MDYSPKEMVRTVITAVSLTVALSVIVLVVWLGASRQQGNIVIPAGNTYLGPNAPNRASGQIPPAINLGRFTAAEDIPWHDVRGNKYPYVFRKPDTLTLISPKGDNPYDLYEISWGTYDPSSTVLIGLDPKTPAGGTKLDYVKNWWKQFSGLKGVASVDAFTNSQGLKGYKARYMNGAGETPNLDVFFEVPEHPTYVIHLANGILDPALFDKIVDSVSWKP